MTIHVVNKRKHKSTDHDFYCGRPGPLGNPFSHIPSGTLADHVCKDRNEAISLHKEYFHKAVKENKAVIEQIQKIQSHLKKHGVVYLICWCHPLPCHCDTIKNYLIEAEGVKS